MLQHLKKVFHKQNDYPIWVIKKVFKEFQSKQNEMTPIGACNKERKYCEKPFVNIRHNAYY